MLPSAERAFCLLRQSRGDLALGCVWVLVQGPVKENVKGGGGLLMHLRHAPGGLVLGLPSVPQERVWQWLVRLPSTALAVNHPKQGTKPPPLPQQVWGGGGSIPTITHPHSQALGGGAPSQQSPRLRTPRDPYDQGGT